MNDNVVKFPKSNLSDVPNMLRQLADDIEAGNYGDINLCLAILPQLDEPFFGFGPESEFTRDAALIGHLELAKAWLVREALSDRD